MAMRAQGQDGYATGIAALSAVLFFLLLFAAPDAGAQSLSEMRAQIDARNAEITELEKEIAAYEAQIAEESQAAETLSAQINRLNTAIQKLKTEQRLAEQRIEKTQLAISSLVEEIMARERQIIQRKDALAAALRSMDELESQTLVEVLLANEKLSDFFGTLNDFALLQDSVGKELAELQLLQARLREEKSTQEAEESRLSRLEKELRDRRSIEEQTKRQKNTLLTDTKNRETRYRELAEDRRAKKDALEAEIRAIEEEIRVTIDPSSLPPAGSGVFSWPLKPVTITQYFGQTPFATRNPQVYNGKGHNGIDLRASVGTPVFAAMSGKVIGIGDTDAQCRGVSYGKWVLLEHANNLSTLYAHLSLSSVVKGQEVGANELIGYSGDTGYTTGPHLHFAVFASKGVQVGQYRSRICGTLMTLPLASFNSYLNPLSYL